MTRDRIRIEAYDPIKGRGSYVHLETGVVVGFRYTDFENETMIPPGEIAELGDNGTIYRPRQRISLFRRVVEWLLRLLT